MYDPLVDVDPPHCQAYVDSYWSSAQLDTPFDGLDGDLDTDLLIIGGGYTGLSCAYHLAREHGRQATVIDANRPGWGCSGRNAGFALSTTGRLGMHTLSKRFGADAAQGIYAEYQRGVEWLRQQNADFGLSEHYQDLGYLKLAHSASAFKALSEQARTLQRNYQDHAMVLNQAEVHDRFGALANCGGILQPQCFGINPLAFCLALANTCQTAGQRIYADTPALQIADTQEGHRVTTPRGHIRCKTLILATNAYGPRQLHPALADRHFPVLSSVLVTEPLTEQQLQRAGLRRAFMAMDTRAMKYYYRLLPDNRLLFGGRGAIRGKDADKAVYRDRLVAALRQTFPRVEGIKPSYFWSGWVSVSLDDLPRIRRVEGSNPLYYAAGYCGAGVTFANWSGKRLAQMVCGALPSEIEQLPFYTTPLKHFPMAGCRRAGLWGFYRWMELQSLFEKYP